MNKGRTFDCNILIIYFLLLTSAVSASDLSVWRNDSQPIKLYGKVIDQFDKPVNGASVILGVISYTVTPVRIISNMSKKEVQTDADGKFSLGISEEVKGASLSVKEISKKGYEWNRAKREDFFDYRNDGIKVNRILPDPNSPVIYHMRKRGENPTYLMTNREFEINMSSGKKLVRSFIDLRNDWKEKHEDGNYDKDFLSKHYDIKVSAVFDKEKSDWTVTFTASGENGGFVLDDKFLSEAPENGYEKEFKIIQHVPTEKEREELENAKEWDKLRKLAEFKFQDKYLYVKSRNPAIYTRMKLADARADDSEEIRINANTATNPYGERNLEFNDELPPEVQGQLYVAIMSAFLKEERTQKPDINKMFDEFKKTHKPEKNIYGNTIWVEIKK